MILFRGQRFKGDKWFYGDLINHRCGKKSINPNPSRYGHGATEGFATLVSNESIGQYTGLKDKNKKKAFEGDKIYIEGCYLGYISLIDGAFNLIEESNQSGSNILNQARMNKMEIIGNIHTNLELMEQS